MYITVHFFFTLTDKYKNIYLVTHFFNNEKIIRIPSSNIHRKFIIRLRNIEIVILKRFFFLYLIVYSTQKNEIKYCIRKRK